MFPKLLKTPMVVFVLLFGLEKKIGTIKTKNKKKKLVKFTVQGNDRDTK